MSDDTGLRMENRSVRRVNRRNLAVIPPHPSRLERLSAARLDRVPFRPPSHWNLLQSHPPFPQREGMGSMGMEGTVPHTVVPWIGAAQGVSTGRKMESVARCTYLPSAVPFA